MAWIEGTEEKTFTIKAPHEKVLAWFSDPAVFREAYDQLESCEELREGTWRWILKEKAEKGVRFKADYTVTYTNSGNRTTWTTEKGNLKSSGESVCEPAGEHTRVRYQETIACDLPIPKLMAKVFRPIVAREIRGGVREFLDISKERLER